MKIGILTFHNADNYGAVLQCYALQEHLKKQYPNDEVFVIDYRNPDIEYTYKSIRKRKSLKENFLQFIYLPAVIKKQKKFETFRKKYLNLGVADFSIYSIIYYGSDQIWNTILTGNDLVYFGKGFNGKKIAYAASDGGEIKFTDEIKELLNGFETISCRESSLAERLKFEGVSVPVSTVSDPIFLLSSKEWLKVAILPNVSNYILAYKISPRLDFDIQAEKLGSKLGKKVIQIVYTKSLRQLVYKNQQIIQSISPEQFIGYLLKSDCVLTTSFHGTAFSILFEKLFYVLSFEKRTERIIELLKKSKMESQFVKEIS